MTVYFIRAGKNGPVKIGHCAGDVERRLMELQVAHWETLRVIRKFEGGAAEEAALHLRFADLHLRGEWFSFSRAMLGDLGLCDVANTEAVSDLSAAIAAERLSLAEVVDECGGTTRVAAECRVVPSAVSNWLARDKIPPAHAFVMWRLAREAGVAWAPAGASEAPAIERRRGEVA